MDELEVFTTALEIASHEDRAKFLNEACGDNARFRQRIEVLLQSWQNAGRFLESPAPHLDTLLHDRVAHAADDGGSAAALGTLGDFRLLREIGRGGMGIVYEAEQISLGRRMALKVLPLFDALDPRQLVRFHNESRAAASLKHPNVVGVHSIGFERGLHYYAMDYIDGRTLAEVIAQLQGVGGTASAAAGGPADASLHPGPSDAADTRTQPVVLADDSTLQSHASREFFRMVARWGIQAAEGLDHAHTLGIVHRDIKPSNLMVDAINHLWITDFGLAMSDAITGPTMSGDLLGTLRYMSPEQASGQRQVLDCRTDIYSLGATLYELVVLQPAFPAENRHELLHHIADTDPPAPHHLNKSVPRDLETIILKAMAKEPSARYSTSRALADDLRRFLDDKPIAAQRPTMRELANKWLRRHRTLAWAATLLLMVTTLLSVTGVLLVARERREAIRQRDEAQRQREEVRRRETSLRQHLSVANIHWAWQAWSSGKLVQATQYLTQQLPAPGEEDTRCFAWYYLWRLCHNPCHVLASHTGAVYSLAFSPDGRTLLSGGVDHKVIHWDVATLQERTRWEDFPDDVNCIRFSSDGRLIATAGEEKQVRIWNAATGQVVQSLTDFALPVAVVFFSRDGTQLLVSEIKWVHNWGYTSLWDLSTGTQQTRFSGARLLAMSPDGQTALLNRGLWNWTVEAERNAPSGLGPALSDCPFAGVFLPDGATVATGGFDHSIPVRRLPDRETVTTLYGHSGKVRSLDVAPRDTLLASGSDDGIVFLWDTLTWDVQSVFPHAGTRVWVVAYSPDGKQLAAGCEDGTIRIWDPSTSRARTRLAGNLPHVTCMAFASNEELLIAGFPNPSSWGLWDATTGQLVKSYESPGEKVETLAASPTEPLVALGIAGGTVRIVDRTSGETRYTIPQGKEGEWEMRELGFSPNGRFLAGARARGAGTPEEDPRTFVIRVWDATNGQEVLVREDSAPSNAAHGEPFAFSPDSRTLAAPVDDRLDLFDLASRTIRRMPSDSLGKVVSTAFSPDGQWIALGTNDWSLRLIDPHNPTREKKLVGPRGMVNNLAFSPDGRILVSGSDAGEVTLWDVQTGEEMCALTGPTGQILWVAFSPDGTRLAASSELPGNHAAVHIWYAPRSADAVMMTTKQQTSGGW